MDYKTQIDLDMVKIDKKESVIRLFWKQKQLGDLYNIFVNGDESVDENGNRINKSITDRYNELYPDKDINGDTINYLTFINVRDDNTLDIYDKIVYNKMYTYRDDCYEIVDDNKVLTTECQLLLDTGKVRPSLKLYISDEIRNYVDPVVDYTDYVNFIRPVLLKKVFDEFESHMNKFTNDFPEHEQKTWSKQEEEAKAYYKDNTVATPLLDGILAVRNIDKDIFVYKIVYKSNLYTKLSGLAIGYRQKAEDEILAMVSVEDLDNVLITLGNDRDNFRKIFS